MFLWCVTFWLLWVFKFQSGFQKREMLKIRGAASQDKILPENFLNRHHEINSSQLKFTEIKRWIRVRNVVKRVSERERDEAGKHCKREHEY